MGRHHETPGSDPRHYDNRRLKAMARLRRIRRREHTWRAVNGAFVAAIVAGSTLAALSGWRTPADAHTAESRTDTVSVTTEQLDATIAEIEEEREDRLAAEAEAEREREERGEAAAEAAADAKAEAVEIPPEPDWVYPSKSRVTSNFGPRWGRMHNGVDFGNKTGDPIWAIGDGKVVHSGWMSGFGNLVIVDHGDGIETYYAHASQLEVGVGQTVEKGETVSLTGSTGNSTGPHLHLEVRVNGEPVEPLEWLADQGVEK
jgi:murein DD-endopeptidase MepM/ murein hydrolase activator NlpD